MNGSKDDILILGGGLSGLAAGSVLTKAGYPVKVIERDHVVGGLSKTIEKNGFRFDLGGHRFFTKDEQINRFVRDLMGDELISVQRSSKILLRDRYFDYPLKPFNALFGLGVTTTATIVADYVREAVKGMVRKKPVVSLEEWVVCNFGRTMFDIYFKEYSEKVWGIDCSRISASWVAQRIKGLSLAKAVKSAFFRFSGRDLATLTDCFLYPTLGIGRMSDRLQEEIERANDVFTGADVIAVRRAGARIEGASVRSRGRVRWFPAAQCISTLPVTKLVTLLDPAPPRAILDAAARLKFRDLVVAAIMVDQERVTDQTWIYIPEKKIPFGRIHEPTNWSPAMAPPGKSLLVAEFFSNRGDAIWKRSDGELTALTVDNLCRLGFIERDKVLDSMIVRVPKAYPLFEVGYRKYADELLDYIGRFENLHVAGRGGMFRYYNMDVALRSGLETAESIIGQPRPASVGSDELVLANT